MRCYYYNRECHWGCAAYCDGGFDNIAGASPCRRELYGMLIVGSICTMVIAGLVWGDVL